MTVTIGTNSQNDLYLGEDGNIVLLSKLPAVEAVCENVSKAQLGEMIFATGDGIPNFQSLWVGTPNIPLWESYLRTSILNSSPDVLEVNNITIRQQNNTLTYSAEIKTIYGTGKVNG